jgi:small subunit ribosomal protein S9
MARKPVKPKKMEYLTALGRRKTAVARIRLYVGTVGIVVNGKPLTDYIRNEFWEGEVVAPLLLTGTIDRFRIEATVRGGGLSGQAGALRHGISRALLKVDPNLRPVLKRAGFLTRDPRAVERKKPGLRKARKAPQFSKR